MSTCVKCHEAIRGSAIRCVDVDGATGEWRDHGPYCFGCQPAIRWDSYIEGRTMRPYTEQEIGRMTYPELKKAMDEGRVPRTDQCARCGINLTGVPHVHSRGKHLCHDCTDLFD